MVRLQQLNLGQGEKIEGYLCQDPTLNLQIQVLMTVESSIKNKYDTISEQQ